MTGGRKTVQRRGRYNMDFDRENGNPYDIVQKACSHIDALRREERMSDISRDRT